MINLFNKFTLLYLVTKLGGRLIDLWYRQS